MLTPGVGLLLGAGDSSGFLIPLLLSAKRKWDYQLQFLGMAQRWKIQRDLLGSLEQQEIKCS